MSQEQRSPGIGILDPADGLANRVIGAGWSGSGRGGSGQPRATSDRRETKQAIEMMDDGIGERTSGQNDSRRPADHGLVIRGLTVLSRRPSSLAAVRSGPLLLLRGRRPSFPAAAAAMPRATILLPFVLSLLAHVVLWMDDHLRSQGKL